MTIEIRFLPPPKPEVLADSVEENDVVPEPADYTALREIIPQLVFPTGSNDTPVLDLICEPSSGVRKKKATKNRKA